MADTTPKLCLICGTNANKIAKYDRYNHAPTNSKKKAGKGKAAEESFSDSDDASNAKSKKKAPVKVTPRTPTAPASSRQTRNKNPKTFAASLCKAMELPDTPDHPFVQIFSQADYCGSCMTKIKDIHANQQELEKIQARLAEYRVDIELDLSKHLQTIPFCKNVRRDLAYVRYEEDIALILDFHGVDKKKKAVKEEPEPEPKRKRRQAALESEEKMKKIDEDEVKTKVSKLEADSDFVMEDSTSSEVDGLGEEKTNGSVAMEDDNAEAVKGEEETHEEAKEEVPEPSEVKEEEVKPVIVKIKKDPNLKCPHCPIPRYFNIPESLEEHVTRVHVDRRKFSCDLCDRKCFSQKELQGHKLKAHDIVSESVGWVCGFCDKDFQQKRYLEDHLDRHEEAKPLNCQFCGRGFARKESLQKAFQIYKGEPVEPCGRCGRQLNLKDYLEHNRKLKEK